MLNCAIADNDNAFTFHVVMSVNYDHGWSKRESGSEELALATCSNKSIATIKTKEPEILKCIK